MAQLRPHLVGGNTMSSCKYILTIYYITLLICFNIVRNTFVFVFNFKK